MYIYNIYNMPYYVNIIISNASEKPIYEQITSQIKQMIATGELKEGEMLPSMRNLARDLRISVITTKRAYGDLEHDGFIETVVGKGSFVASKNTEMLREQQMRIVEGHLQKAVDIARTYGLPLEDMKDVLDYLYGGE